MNTNIIKSKSFLFFLTILFSLGTSKLFASQASEEWIDVEVVVNVVDGANAANIDDAIKKANDILKQAKVRLVKKGTDPNAKADSDNSGALDKTERNKAREEGQKALNKAVGPGKGIKIDVANNIDANDASAVGISIHRNPVIIVEPDPNSNELGKTITHELGHVFTLNYDLNDVNFINRLMYAFTGSGTDLTPGEVNEIRKGAGLRGTSYFVMPRILPGKAVAVPPGMDYNVRWFGAILDNFHDVFVIDPYNPVHDPNDPTIQYADIGEVINDFMFTEGDTIKYYMTIQVQLGELPPSNWNVDSFFDISYQVEFGPPLGRAHIGLHNWVPVSAIWYDANNLPTPVILDVQVDTESEYSGMPHYAVPHNKTLRVRTPLDDIILTPDMPGPIIVTVSSQHLDHRYDPDPATVMLMDSTQPFKVSDFPPCLTAGLTFMMSPSTVSYPDGQIAGNLKINGCCFDNKVSSGTVSVSTNERLIYPEHPVTVTDGRFSASIPATLLRPNPNENWPKWYRVDFSPLYNGLPENAPQGATGFFKYCPGGEIAGDLDSNCVVDVYDLAALAQHWLENSRL